MPLSAITEAPRELWAFVGSLAGAAVVLLVGWMRVHSTDRTTDITDRAALAKSQHDFNVMLQEEVKTLHSRLANMDLALKQERESCKAQMAEMDQRHQGQITELQARMSREERR